MADPGGPAVYNVDNGISGPEVFTAEQASQQQLAAQTQQLLAQQQQIIEQQQAMLEAQKKQSNQPATTTIVIDKQPFTITPVKPGITYGREPQSMECPECKSQITTQTKHKLGNHAKVAMLQLALVCLWIFIWLPLVCTWCQDVEHTCPNCNKVLGTQVVRGRRTRRRRRVRAF